MTGLILVITGVATGIGTGIVVSVVLAQIFKRLGVLDTDKVSQAQARLCQEGIHLRIDEREKQDTERHKDLKQVVKENREESQNNHKEVMSHLILVRRGVDKLNGGKQ